MVGACLWVGVGGRAMGRVWGRARGRARSMGRAGVCVCVSSHAKFVFVTVPSPSRWLEIQPLLLPSFSF